MHNKTDTKHPNVLFAISNIAIGGGAEKVATTIANEFLAHGIPTTLLTYYSAKSEHVFNGEHISLREPERHSLIGKLFRAPHRIWSIKKVCEERDIDVVVSFLEESNYYTLLSKLLLFNRVRMIVSVRNDPRFYPWLYRFLIRFLYPFAEKVVAVTKGVEEVLKTDFKLKNTTTIYNPVDFDLIQKRSQEPLPTEYEWIKDRQPLFVTVGRLTQQKGQWHLIRAFCEVLKYEPKATLFIIGEGPMKQRLEALIADLKLSEHVYLIGKQQNIFPFLKAANVFVLPSLWEGMPNVLLEAVAANVPVIATDASTGAREILAPELALQEKIVYPYRTEAGVLMERFEESNAFGPHGTLSKEERQLADTMTLIIQQQWSGAGIMRECFTPPVVFKQWLEELV